MSVVHRYKKLQVFAFCTCSPRQQSDAVGKFGVGTLAVVLVIVSVMIKVIKTTIVLVHFHPLNCPISVKQVTFES